VSLTCGGCPGGTHDPSQCSYDERVEQQSHGCVWGPVVGGEAVVLWAALGSERVR